MRPILLALTVLLALVMQPALATSREAPETAKQFRPDVTFYVARGQPNSCGPGCDRWIAVEGRLDTGAALRLRKFYAAQKTANLPLYLHSAGGDVRQGMAMGRLLRERKSTARVGRTIVKECGVNGQTDAACLKLKQSGRELEAELTETASICNSSCAYLLMGAVAREIAPNVTVGVHTARVTMSYRGGREPPKVVRELATVRAAGRLERDLAAYMGEMGVDRALLDLIRTVKYEQLHVLKRDELIRYGIDKREFVETGWRFDNRRGMSFIEKFAQERDPKEPKGYRSLSWRLSCAYSADAVRFDYFRSNGGEGLASAVIRFGADQRLVLAATPDKAVRGTRVANTVVEGLKAATQMSLMEVAADASAPRETIVSTDGLLQAADQLLKACRANVL